MTPGNDAQRQRDSCGYSANSGIFGVSRSVFWQAHPATIRMLMALASLSWALSILHYPAILTTPPYQYMPTVMPWWAWVTGFLLYFVGVFWRIYDHRPRVRIALAINILGFLLWFALTICVNLAAGRFIPGTSLELVTCFFAAWALIRTGVGKDVGTP